MFSRCSSLVNVDLRNWKTTSVESIDSIFSECKSLKTVNLSGWDISSVKSISWMFENCSSLSDLDLSGWNTSSVATFEGVFKGCTAMSKFRYSNTASNILSELPIYDGWYQDNKGPYSVYNLPKVADGVTALLTRKKPTDSSDSQKPDPTPPVTPSPQPTPPASDVKPTQMRRLYNPNSGEHFYTANMAEKNHLVKVGRKAEGIGW